MKGRFLHDEREHGRKLLLAEEALGVVESRFVERGLTMRGFAEILSPGSQQAEPDDSDYDGPRAPDVTISIETSLGLLKSR